MSKAFDSVWHDDLLFKPKCLGLSGKYYHLTNSFLSSRHQRVVLSGQFSKGSLSSVSHTNKILGTSIFNWNDFYIQRKIQGLLVFNCYQLDWKVHNFSILGAFFEVLIAIKHNHFYSECKWSRLVSRMDQIWVLYFS